MDVLATNLVHRLQIEQSYSLVADIQEEEVDLPGLDSWLESIENEKDEGKRDERLLQLIEAVEQHEAAWAPIGGAFRQTKLVDDEGNEQDRSLVAAPPLLALKPYVARVLIKFTGMAHKVILIVENEIPRGLSGDLLLQAGRELRSYFAAGEDSETKGKKRKKRHKSVPVLFEVLVVGRRVSRDSVGKALDIPCRGTRRRERIFVIGYLLDVSGRSVWSTAKLNWPRRRFYTYAIRKRHQSAEQIQAQVNQTRLNLGLLIGGAVLALLLVILGRISIAMFGLTDIEQLYGFVDFVAPLIVVGLCVSLLRIKVHAMRQAQQTMIAFLIPYAAIMIIGLWPLNVLLALQLAVKGFVLWAMAGLIGVLSQLD